jgi:hypothetical protein
MLLLDFQCFDKVKKKSKIRYSIFMYIKFQFSKIKVILEYSM